MNYRAIPSMPPWKCWLRFTIRDVLVLTAILAAFTAINASGRGGVVSQMYVRSHSTWQVCEIKGRIYGWPNPFYGVEDDSKDSDYSASALAENIAVALAVGGLALILSRILR